MKKFDVKNNQLIGETYNKVLNEKWGPNPAAGAPGHNPDIPAGQMTDLSPFRPGGGLDPAGSRPVPEDDQEERHQKVIMAVEALATQLAELHINLDDAINLWRSWVKAGKPPIGEPEDLGDPGPQHPGMRKFGRQM